MYAVLKVIFELQLMYTHVYDRNFCAPSKFELIEMSARENASSEWWFVKNSGKVFLFTTDQLSPFGTIEYVVPSGRHNAVEVRLFNAYLRLALSYFL